SAVALRETDLRPCPLAARQGDDLPGGEDVDRIAAVRPCWTAAAGQMREDRDLHPGIGIAGPGRVAVARAGDDAERDAPAAGHGGEAAASVLHHSEAAAGQEVEAHLRDEPADAGGEAGIAVVRIAGADDRDDGKP